MTLRLSDDALEQLPADVKVPNYDRTQVGAGIVHLGIGAFHRAHQAWYTEQVLRQSGGDWAIIGASLRSRDVAQRLNPQGGLYTVVERAGDRAAYQVIGAVKTVLVAPDDPEALVNELSSPDIRIITLTITEKGYLFDGAAQGLRLDDPSIRGDLERYPAAPATAIGLLAAGLSRRRATAAGGVTLLSCDNLSHNGAVLKKVLTDFVAVADASLLSWIDDHVTFPSSMVDRIVPAATEGDLDQLEDTVGYRDEAAVFTEPFSQWVIEDNFAQGAPAWESVGVLLTSDVTPFETMKLRLLNGSHSLIAYLGCLAGYQFVHEVMADNGLASLVRAYMDQQAGPTLAIPAGFDIERYKDNLCARFANSALNHKTAQIAQDGSQKIPQRWVAVVNDLAKSQRPTRILALAVAAWIRYQDGQRDDGSTFVVDDPLAGQLADAIQRARAANEDVCESVLGVQAVFGELKGRNPGFVGEVSAFYRELSFRGVSAVSADLVANDCP